jgi:hypothetical protein
VSFTGVSGFSLLLSDFFMPAFMQNFASPVGSVASNATVTKDTISKRGQQKKSQVLLNRGVLTPQVDLSTAAATTAALQTADNSPGGGHCEFDGRDFVSGVQLMADSYAAVLQGSYGLLADTDMNVLNPVPGNEKLVFSRGS